MNLTRFHSLTLGLILCFSFRCMAQEQKLLTVISKIVSELAEETGEANAEMLTSLLFDLATEPAAINRGDSAEISRLFFLTPFQAATLVSYVRTTGPVVSFPELASLPGFNRESVESLMPFITLDIPPAGAPEGTGVYHRLLASASVRFQGGFADPSVNPIRNSLRYRLNSGSLTASLTAVSDAGEAPVWSGRPDFISGGVAVKGNMGIANFIAGDYNARFGMGLVINSGYKPFLTLTAPSYMGYRDGFSLSTSVNESNYLRGSAITMATRLFSVSGMASVRYRDARIETDTSGNIYAVILSTPPPHSSLSGVSATGVLRESSYGVNIGTVKGSFRWALTACYTEFSREVGEIDNSPGGIFRFSGSENLNAGVSYRMSGGKVSGAGEFAVSSSGGFAMAHTLNIRFDDRLTANLIYRYYDRQYYGHHAAGPGRNSITGNEEGLMARVSFEAARNVFL
ncbi:MAG: helix-hairpin-helix domain-containing protein, partial [Bacteroidetes bacterium]|nr:helix-hairpin-helix domain-containing protein [Bacteroidota bacterium]